MLVYIGRCIDRRRTLCLAFSILHLLNAPLGTILSIFALILLKRPAVRQAFMPQPVPESG